MSHAAARRTPKPVKIKPPMTQTQAKPNKVAEAYTNAELDRALEWDDFKDYQKRQDAYRPLNLSNSQRDNHNTNSYIYYK